MNLHCHNACVRVNSSLLKIGRCSQNTQLTQIAINKHKSKESRIVKYAKS